MSVKKNMDNDVLKIQSPFNLKPALQFAFLFSGILLFAEWMGDLFGDRGLYLTAILAGLVDVDAITVSTATLVNESLVPQVATVAIILAVVANTLVKIFIFFFGGGRAVALRIAGAMLFMVFCGIIASLAS